MLLAYVHQRQYLTIHHRKAKTISFLFTIYGGIIRTLASYSFANDLAFPLLRLLMIWRQMLSWNDFFSMLYSFVSRSFCEWDTPPRVSAHTKIGLFFIKVSLDKDIKFMAYKWKHFCTRHSRQNLLRNTWVFV